MRAPTFITRTRLRFEWEDYPDPPEVAFRLANMEAHFLNRVPFLQRAKFIARRDMAEKFQAEKDPDGKKWAALKAPAVDQQGILQLTGKMRDDSMGSGPWQVESDGLYFDTGRIPEYWVYHEQPQGAIGRRLKRRSFIPLTEKGRAQTMALFSQWAEEGIMLAGKRVTQGRSPLGTFESLAESQSVTDFF